jgi:hypothetical protein
MDLSLYGTDFFVFVDVTGVSPDHRRPRLPMLDTFSRFVTIKTTKLIKLPILFFNVPDIKRPYTQVKLNMAKVHFENHPDHFW